MYTEEYEKRGFSLRGFLLKLLLVIVFVVLLAWLLPKFIVPAINKTTKLNNSTKTCTSQTCNVTGIDALTSQIYQDNINRMKEAAITYYTKDRLPQEIGSSNTMTLSDMIGKKLITPLIDKNNKACDVEGSYVKITKQDDEYLLKVNLKDSEKEDYILVHLGCYSYCESYVCQKQGTSTSSNTNIPVKGSKQDQQPTKHYCVYYNGNYYDNSGNIVTQKVYIEKCTTPVVEKHYCVYYNGKYYDKNGNVVTETEYKKSCVPEEKHYCVYYNGKYYDKNGNAVTETEYRKSCGIEEKHYCVYYNGKYYDKNGNVVSLNEYLKSCGTEEKHYCVYYNGKYYDKNGNVVTEAEYKKSCVPEEKHYCVYYNGKYYDKNGNVVSEAEYKKSCMPEEKHYCVYYNGKYYDKNGNVVSETEYRKSCGLEIEYLYEYKKTTSAQFSAWTDWTSWAKTDCSTKEINCSDSDTSCLKKLQLLKRKEEIGTYEKTYAKTREMLVQTGSYTRKACANYSYVIINNVTYITTTKITYTRINTITATTRASAGGWVYRGRVSFSTPPKDTPGAHYKYVGADFSGCSSTCTTAPKYIYDYYTFTSMSKVSSTSVYVTPVGAEASCTAFTTTEVPIYGTITVTEKAKRKEPLYGDVCYQSTKTRKLVSAGSTQYKWSVYNDTSLLNSGWVYTGNKKQK